MVGVRPHRGRHAARWKPRRPPRERTLANKNTAISLAACRAAVDLLPGSKASVFDPLMQRLGYDVSRTAWARAQSLFRGSAD
jgi:hypothetical protein